NLTITLNNGEYSHEIVRATLEEKQWTVVGCGVDLPARRVLVYLNGNKVDDFHLPKDFKLKVIGSDVEKLDKDWSFANYGNGCAFQGYIDELIIYNRLLAFEELSKFTLNKPKVDNKATKSSGIKAVPGGRRS